MLTILILIRLLCFIGNVPSPGSSVPSLNTPMNPSSNPAPSPLAQEDIAYREKVRQLSKYIEPLRKMIALIGNEGNTSKDLYIYYYIFYIILFIYLFIYSIILSISLISNCL